MSDVASKAPPRQPAALLSRRPIFTWIAIGLSVLFSLPQLLSEFGIHLAALDPVARLASPSPGAIWSGQYFLLLTAIFAHGGLLHILFNMMWLYQLGWILEATLSRPAWVAFLLLSGLVACCAELAFSGVPGIGMSGVVYAMFGLMWAGRREKPLWRAVATPGNLKLLVGWGIFCVIATWAHWMPVANFAHGAGFLFGIACGSLFVAKRWRALSGATLALLCALSFLSVTKLPWLGEWYLWRGDEAYRSGNVESAAALYEKSLRVLEPIRPPQRALVLAELVGLEERLGHLRAADLAREALAREPNVRLGPVVPVTSGQPGQGQPKDGARE